MTPEHRSRKSLDDWLEESEAVVRDGGGDAMSMTFGKPTEQQHLGTLPAGNNAYQRAVNREIEVLRTAVNNSRPSWFSDLVDRTGIYQPNTQPTDRDLRFLARDQLTDRELRFLARDHLPYFQHSQPCTICDWLYDNISSAGKLYSFPSGHDYLVAQEQLLLPMAQRTFDAHNSSCRSDGSLAVCVDGPLRGMEVLDANIHGVVAPVRDPHIRPRAGGGPYELAIPKRLRYRRFAAALVMSTVSDGTHQTVWLMSCMHFDDQP